MMIVWYITKLSLKFVCVNEFQARQSSHSQASRAASSYDLRGVGGLGGGLSRLPGGNPAQKTGHSRGNS